VLVGAEPREDRILSELAGAVRARRVSSRQLVERSLERIARPFGLQVTGPRFRDQLLLDLASAWEQAHPWPRSADGYEPFDAGLA